MITRNARAFLTAGILAVAALSARAGEAQSHCGPDCAPACAPAPCAPQYRTVCETICVPEHYTTYKTCYRNETYTKTHTGYKCVKVPEKRTRTVTTYKKVPVWSTVKKTYCVKVPVWSTVKKTYCVKVPYQKTITTYKRKLSRECYTTWKTKTVRRGHWETRCVQKGPSLLDRFSGLFNKKGCGDCGGCNDCCEPAPRFKTKKVWVSCKECVRVPVKRWRITCNKVPVCKTITCYRTETRCKDVKVCSYRTETRCKDVKVCSYKCVPENKTECYTVYSTKKVPYTYTTTHCRKVPYKVAVKACRMVRKTITKKVPVCGGCDNGCGNGCH